MRRPIWLSLRKKPWGPSRRCSASRARTRRSSWPSKSPPYPPPRAGDAAYFYRRDIGRIWRITAGLEYRIEKFLEVKMPLHGRHRPLKIARLPASGQTVMAAAARSAKPAARLCLGLHPALMLGDPCLGVRFGFELADLGRMTVRDGYLDTERPVVKRDYPIGRLCVGVGFWHFHAARSRTRLP